MGKPTGFLDYEREDARAESPKERIKHFNEFHIPLSREEQQKQGAKIVWTVEYHSVSQEKYY